MKDYKTKENSENKTSFMINLHVISLNFSIDWFR